MGIEIRQLNVNASVADQAGKQSEEAMGEDDKSEQTMCCDEQDKKRVQQQWLELIAEHAADRRER